MNYHISTLLEQLEEVSDGRIVDISLHPKSPKATRACVYIRGNEQDGWTTCISSGHGSGLCSAVKMAINGMGAYNKQMKKRVKK